jgi:hypothetical protein
MDSQLDPRRQRKFFVHAQRQDASDFWTRGRKPANEEHYLQLKPASVFLENGVIVRRTRIRRPLWKWL